VAKIDKVPARDRSRERERERERREERERERGERKGKEGVRLCTVYARVYRVYRR